MDGGADALTNGDGGSLGYCNYSTWIALPCLIPVLLSAGEILTHGKVFLFTGIRRLGSCGGDSSKLSNRWSRGREEKRFRIYTRLQIATPRWKY